MLGQQGYIVALQRERDVILCEPGGGSGWGWGLGVGWCMYGVLVGGWVGGRAVVGHGWERTSGVCDLYGDACMVLCV